MKHIKLKEIRQKYQYTSAKMGEMLGISKPYYSQLENDTRRLSYEMAVKIASLFNMKSDEIFYEDYTINND